MTEKLCFRCGLSPRKPKHPWCKGCFSTYMAEWLEARRVRLAKLSERDARR